MMTTPSITVELNGQLQQIADSEDIARLLAGSDPVDRAELFMERSDGPSLVILLSRGGWTMASTLHSSQPWHDFLSEAQGIVQTWEQRGTGRLLATSSAAELAELIARGLAAAYQRGKDEPVT